MTYLCLEAIPKEVNYRGAVQAELAHMTDEVLWLHIRILNHNGGRRLQELANYALAPRRD